MEAQVGFMNDRRDSDLSGGIVFHENHVYTPVHNMSETVNAAINHPSTHRNAKPVAQGCGQI